MSQKRQDICMAPQMSDEVFHGGFYQSHNYIIIVHNHTALIFFAIAIHHHHHSMLAIDEIFWQIVLLNMYACRRVHLYTCEHTTMQQNMSIAVA